VAAFSKQIKPKVYEAWETQASDSDAPNDSAASSEGEEGDSSESSDEGSVVIVSHNNAQESEQPRVGKGKAKLVEGEFQELPARYQLTDSEWTATAKRTTTNTKCKRSGSESDLDDQANGKCLM
jgi:hypothetical protein